MSYVEIYRVPGRIFSFYEARAFDGDGLQYRWVSPAYFWLWSARIQAPKDARKHTHRPMRELVSMCEPGQFIERIPL